MKNPVHYLLLCVFGLSFVAGSAVADELSDVSKELYPLRREVKKLLPKTDRFKNPVWKEANMASIRAKAAVSKTMSEHPALKDLREQLAAAKKAYNDVRSGDDKELIAERRKKMRSIDGQYYKAAFQLKEVKDAQQASIVARRKVEAIEYSLISKLSDEAKVKVTRLIALEKRQRELLEAKKKK
ncbi:MAG: hypothetical protein ACPG32_06805 [Akkermansiaceae bacterium]